MITVDYRGGDGSAAARPARLRRGDLRARRAGAVGVVRPAGRATRWTRSATRRARTGGRPARSGRTSRLREQLAHRTIDEDTSAQLDRLLGTAGLGGYKHRPRPGDLRRGGPRGHRHDRRRQQQRRQARHDGDERRRAGRPRHPRRARHRRPSCSPPTRPPRSAAGWRAPRRSASCRAAAAGLRRARRCTSSSWTPTAPINVGPADRLASVRRATGRTSPASRSAPSPGRTHTGGADPHRLRPPVRATSPGSTSSVSSSRRPKTQPARRGPAPRSRNRPRRRPRPLGPADPVATPPAGAEARGRGAVTDARD